MDEKTSDLRDIFVETTGSDTVTERQAESRGTLTDRDEAAVDERVRELVATMRERYDFSTDLDDATLLDHAKLKGATLAALRRDVDPDGVNTGQNLGDSAAGGSVDHLHTHVVPRWNGDTNFMPVTGDTKVIVEAIDRTYEHLHAGFAAGDDVVDPGDADAGDAVELDFDV